MFSSRSMVKYTAVLMAGAVAFAFVAAGSVHAWGGSASGTTRVSFSGPVALPGVTLPAGTYTFDRPNANVINLARVSSRDGRYVYFRAFTKMVSRPAGLELDRQITFGESPAGTAPPIKTWFPSGEQVGHEFIYSTR